MRCFRKLVMLFMCFISETSNADDEQEYSNVPSATSYVGTFKRYDVMRKRFNPGIRNNSREKQFVDIGDLLH